MCYAFREFWDSTSCKQKARLEGEEVRKEWSWKTGRPNIPSLIDINQSRFMYRLKLLRFVWNRIYKDICSELKIVKNRLKLYSYK